MRFLLLASLAAVAFSSPRESVQFWNECKECVNGQKIFCFTNGKCLDDLSIDAPSDSIWPRCPNPLMIEDSCRTKGVHPPGTPEAELDLLTRNHPEIFNQLMGSSEF